MSPTSFTTKLLIGLVLAAIMMVGNVKYASADTQLLTAPLAEYVRVPGRRLVHQSCVHYFSAKPGVRAGIDANNDWLENGTIVKHYDPCPYEELQAEPSISGWLSAAVQPPPPGNFSPGFGLVQTFMTVPPFLPCDPNCSNAVDFFWNGLQTAFDEQPLIQPVLQWGIAHSENAGSFGSDTSWGIASWFCNGQCFAYNYFEVTPGDSLELFLDLQPGGISNGEWIVGGVDYNSGKGSNVTLYLPGIPFQSADVAIAEVDVNFCNQLPAQVVFRDNVLWDSNGNSVPFAPNLGTVGCTCGCNIVQNGSTLTFTQ